MVDQNDSTSALSTLEATRPIEPSRPAARSRWPNSQEVYWAPLSAWTIVPGCGWRCQRAICKGVDDELGADVVRDRPADDPSGERVDDGEQ